MDREWTFLSDCRLHLITVLRSHAEYVVVSWPEEQVKVGPSILLVDDLLEVLPMDHQDSELDLEKFSHREQLDALGLATEDQDLPHLCFEVSFDEGRELAQVFADMLVVEAAEVGDQEGIEQDRVVELPA